MHRIEIDSGEKALRVTVSNKLNKMESIAFLDELEKNIREIDLKQHTLVFEIKNIDNTSSGAMPLQDKILKLIELYKILI